jgi:hypothetical protein
MNKAFTESTVEDAALAWLESLGYTVRHGPNIVGGLFVERMDRTETKPMDWSAVSAENATTPRNNMQEIYIALKRQDHAQVCWPNREWQPVQKMQQFTWANWVQGTIS